MSNTIEPSAKGAAEKTPDPFADAPWRTISETMAETGMAETTLRTFIKTGLITAEDSPRGRLIRPAEAIAVAERRRAKTKNKAPSAPPAAPAVVQDDLLPVLKETVSQLKDLQAIVHDAGARAGKAEAANDFLRDQVRSKDAEAAALRQEADQLRANLDRRAAELANAKVEATEAAARAERAELEAQMAAAARKPFWRR